MVCNEHLESIHGGAKAGALGSSKTCAQVFEGHSLSHLVRVRVRVRQA
jgi:hypothetical protein